MFLFFVFSNIITDIREKVGHRINREDFHQNVSRKHLMSKQDIHNVKRNVVDRQIKRHENDAISVGILVQELKNETFNPILFYKAQGCESETKPFLKKHSFILVLQTKFQMELYRKFCNKILCIDATHSTNAYRFKLITCLVQDDFSKGNSWNCGDNSNKYSCTCMQGNQ